MKLTDTQRRLLAAASQRDDRAVERPSNLPGGAAGKVVAKLLTEGLVEEIPSRGSSPVWRRDGDVAHTLRIAKRGLQAIRVDDEATAADELPKKPPARSGKSRKSALASGTAKMRAGSKQAGVIALLQPPARHDDRGHHEGHRLAAALGARLLRRRGAQEAGAHAGLRQDRRRTGLPDRRPGGQSQAGEDEVDPPGGLTAMAASLSGLEDEIARLRDLDLRVCGHGGVRYSVAPRPIICPAACSSACWPTGFRPSASAISTRTPSGSSTGWPRAPRRQRNQGRGNSSLPPRPSTRNHPGPGMEWDAPAGHGPG